MATNNATNTSNPLTVPQGGTGNASDTAYAVLCGGTTSTGAFQSIASVGTSGHFLTSNGAGALPTFQAGSITTGLGMSADMGTISGNPAASTTYFMRSTSSFTTGTASGSAAQRLYAPQAGTLNNAFGAITVQGTLASAQNCTIALRLNNTTDFNISTTLQLTGVSNTFSSTSLGISMAAGDYVEFKFISGAWITSPTTVRFSGSIYIS